MFRWPNEAAAMWPYVKLLWPLVFFYCQFQLFQRSVNILYLIVTLQFCARFSPNSPRPACLQRRCWHEYRLTRNWLTVNFTASNSSSDEMCFLKVLSPVYTIQPVVKPVVKPVVQPGLTTGCMNSGCSFNTVEWTVDVRSTRLSNLLYNRFDNRLYRVKKHPTGCQTGCIV